MRILNRIRIALFPSSYSYERLVAREAFSEIETITTAAFDMQIAGVHLDATAWRKMTAASREIWVQVRQIIAANDETWNALASKSQMNVLASKTAKHIPGLWQELMLSWSDRKIG